METQFTPLYVNPPKAGKKWGSIKNASGERYMIPGGSEGLFAKDQPVNIRWEKATWTDTGLVQAVNNQPLGEPQVPTGMAPGGVLAPAIPAPANPAAQAAPAPVAPQPTGAASNGRYTDQQRAQDIFVTGVVGRALAA